jgi:hypothetical protein
MDMIAATVFIVMLCSVQGLPIQEGGRLQENKEAGAPLMRKVTHPSLGDAVLASMEKGSENKGSNLMHNNAHASSGGVAATKEVGKAGGSHLMRRGHKHTRSSGDAAAVLASMEISGNGELNYTPPPQVGNTAAQQKSGRSRMQTSSLHGPTTADVDVVWSSESVSDTFLLALRKKLLHTAESEIMHTSTHLSFGLLSVSMLFCLVGTIQGFHKLAAKLFDLRACTHDGAEVYEEQGVTLSVCHRCGQKRMFLASLNTWVPCGEIDNAEDKFYSRTKMKTGREQNEVMKAGEGTTLAQDPAHHVSYDQ